MSMIYRRLDQQQEESRKSFEAINTRMDRMDDQLSFLCYSNQMANEQMLFPYQNTSRQFKEMEMQGILVTMANLAIHRQKEEEMNQERMRYDQILQEAVAQQAREANKGKARKFVPDSEEEDSEELASSASEEWKEAWRAHVIHGALTSYVGIKSRKANFDREYMYNVYSLHVVCEAWRQRSHLRQRPHVYVVRGAKTFTSSKSFIGNPIQVIRHQFHSLIKGMIGRLKI
ncbi:hypothetical protein PIB30_026296 [Stylosanthes scabra]|uniref:Uncharacterized protein n=1 Tax=Stylosanthes scabra TaxID=79078 RepID=A0ABU6V9B2_9FABA|nr:hypothetical protein [Stylosanthes scabra]